MVVTFKDKEQLEYISSFVNSVTDIHIKSTPDTIKGLADSLSNLLTYVKTTPGTELSIDFTRHAQQDKDQIYCLYNICKMLNNTGADEINAGIDMYCKLKPTYAESDVPRFLQMLKHYGVPAEHCVELFKEWSAKEGTGILAEMCMKIQSKLSINMTPVWQWLWDNNSSPGTNWQDELTKYKEAINGRS